MRRGDRVFAVVKFHRLAIHDPVDRYIHRDLIALHQLDLKEDQLRCAAGKIDAIPIGAIRLIDQARPRGTRQGNVFRIVSVREDSLPQGNFERALPGMRGLAFHAGGERPAIYLQMKCAGCGRGVDAQRHVARGIDPKLRIEVGVPRVQSLGEQRLASLLYRYRDARFWLEIGQRIERIQKAILIARNDARELRRHAAHGAFGCQDYGKILGERSQRKEQQTEKGIGSGHELIIPGFGWVRASRHTPP